jgi:hypothetical protein
VVIVLTVIQPRLKLLYFNKQFKIIKIDRVDYIIIDSCTPSAAGASADDKGSLVAWLCSVVLCWWDFE